MNRTTILSNGLLLALVLASGIPASPGEVQSGAATGKPVLGTATSRYRPNKFSRRAGLYYRLEWGIDFLSIKSVESGELIRFNYRVVDAAKAQPLNDKKSEPQLFDERARAKLVVPSLEQVGQLRQSTTPEAGKVYWMVFSNKGRLVKRGDRVSVVIGKFHADGLIVE